MFDMHKFVISGVIGLLAAAPSSTNYILRNYDVGSGGSTSSSSTNYQLNGVTGSQSSSLQSSTNYQVGNGENNVQNSNVPPAPTFSNPSNYYDRLKVVLNTGNNPSDTKYQIAISNDNFVTTKYIQNDNTIGTGTSITTYQTYTAWGGAGGFLVLGLSPSTTYQVKVRSLQGNSTGSAFGPSSNAATVATSIAISLSTTLTSTPPFPVSFTSLTPGTVVSGNADAIIGLTSNALNGGQIYIKSNNSGLTSASTTTTISSLSTDLASANSGYGAQVIAASQTSGGPLSAMSPYDGSNDSIGSLSTTLQALLKTNGPITAASGTVRLKAKASSAIPSASDYSDVLTLVAAMNF